MYLDCLKMGRESMWGHSVLSGTFMCAPHHASLVSYEDMIEKTDQLGLYDETTCIIKILCKFQKDTASFIILHSLTYINNNANNAKPFLCKVQSNISN